MREEISGGGDRQQLGEEKNNTIIHTGTGVYACAALLKKSSKTL